MTDAPEWRANRARIKDAMDRQRRSRQSARLYAVEQVHGPGARFGLLYWTMFQGARKNARVRDLPWGLSDEDLNALVLQANGRCQVSGIKFSWATWPHSSKRPFCPSLDRISSGSGYTLPNCRLVACMVNLALNEWGESAFWLMADAAAKRLAEVGGVARMFDTMDAREQRRNAEVYRVQQSLPGGCK